MSILEDIKAFSTEDICEFITKKIAEIDASTVSAFRKNKISGEVFLSLTDEEIKKEICCTLGERKSLLSLIASYKVKVISLRYIISINVL